MLELRDIHLRWDRRPLLDGVNLRVDAGHTVALLGPSGSGKSTLLKIVAGIETPEQGSVWFDGEDITRTPPHRRGFALMFQFNPRSPLTREQFTQLHTLMGDAPVLPAAGPLAADEYRDNLRTARALLGAAYGFDAANLGDDDGNGGW